MATKSASSVGLTSIKSQLGEFIDNSLKFFDMMDFQRRLRDKHMHPIIEKLKGSGLVKATSFPIVVHALELIFKYISHYNLETK